MFGLSNGSVGEYDVTTGAPINAGFITGLDSPVELAVTGNTLFVATGNRVGKYNATTGKAINAKFITGLELPGGLVVSGNKLFVT